MKVIFALLQLLALVPIVKNWDSLKLGKTSRTVSFVLAAPALTYVVYALTNIEALLIMTLVIYMIAPLFYLYVFRVGIITNVTEPYKALTIVTILGLVLPTLLKAQHYPGASVAILFQYVAVIASVYVYFKDSESKAGILHSSLMVYLIIQSMITIKTSYL